MFSSLVDSETGGEGSGVWRRCHRDRILSGYRRGILLASAAGGFNVDLFSYLFWQHTGHQQGRGDRVHPAFDTLGGGRVGLLP